LQEVLPHLTTSPRFILEPSAGQGAFVGPLRRRFPKAKIVAMDLDDGVGPWKGATDSLHGDFRSRDTNGPIGQYIKDAGIPYFDLIVCNPPFKQYLDFMDVAITVAENVAFLVPLSFLSSSDRSKFYGLCQPTHVFILPNRPFFATPVDGMPNKSDRSDYCWVCWSMKRPRITNLYWLSDVPVEVRRQSSGRLGAKAGKIKVRRGQGSKLPIPSP
jgi:hypothetical protein